MDRSALFLRKVYGQIIKPAILFSILIFVYAMIWVVFGADISTWEKTLLALGLTGSIYGLFIGVFSVRPLSNKVQRFEWLHIVIIGVSLGVVAILLPSEIFFLIYILFVLNIISAALIFSANQVRVLILIAFAIHLWGYSRRWGLIGIRDWLFLITFPTLNFIVAKVICRFQETISNSLQQVNTINAISRTLSSSLDEEEVHTWFKEAIQDIFDADTYYLAILDGDEFDLGLFYDDGEYYPDVRLPMDGTLGGWTIRNRKTLFLNDLRTEPNLEGVKIRLIGRKKTSLSWLGVPFFTEYITGMSGIASYAPLAFTDRDVEMLESLTQQAALALNNARQHKLMIEQTRLDSLTKVYNHGYFLLRLKEELQLAKEGQYPLSVIMLDVDFFKDYNDMYGHLAGDEVLMLMVKAVKRFIKQHDVIGRWGGEEFAICLPGTSLEDAQRVAVRIQGALAKMRISVVKHKDIPMPTVSQGIAEFPREAQETFELVDLADLRLYVAKERGRNQIVPQLGSVRLPEE